MVYLFSIFILEKNVDGPQLQAIDLQLLGNHILFSSVVSFYLFEEFSFLSIIYICIGNGVGEGEGGREGRSPVNLLEIKSTEKSLFCCKRLL